MPIYEYRRKPDGSVFEFDQKMSDAPLTVCPTTGVPVERLISATSFQLKGSGWYTTDYKKQDSKPVPPKKEEPAVPAPKVEAPKAD